MIQLCTQCLDSRGIGLQDFGAKLAGIAQVICYLQGAVGSAQAESACGRVQFGQVHWGLLWVRDALSATWVVGRACPAATEGTIWHPLAWFSQAAKRDADGSDGPSRARKHKLLSFQGSA